MPLRFAESVLDRVPGLVLIADRTGRVVYANHAVESMLGYGVEEVLGDGWGS